MFNARFWFVIASLLLLLLYPLFGGGFGLDLVTKTMIYALLALSLELLVGGVGLVCFGQAAFFGLGAYSVVWFSAGAASPNLLLLLLGAMAMGAGYALFVGALSLRTRGVYFIMVTLAFAQMAYYVVHDTPLGGGTDGVYLNAKPRFGEVSFDKPLLLYYLCLTALSWTLAFLAVLMASRFGRALAGIRVNEERMRATGFSTFPYKLAAFVVSGALAGLAGALFAIKDGFVNPELLSWHLSGALLVMIILGGIGQLRGALIGAFAFALLQELFQSEALFGSFAKHWHLSLGLSIIAVVAFMPRGLVGIPSQISARLMGRGSRRADSETSGAFR